MEEATAKAPVGDADNNQATAEETGSSEVQEVKALDEREIGVVLDIPLKVNVELGRTKILVGDLIKLHQGSVLELNKLAGEPLDVLVNDQVVAKGEVIVVNEKFGIRLTDVVNHTQRIRKLGD